MLEMLEEVFDRVTGVIKVLCCIGFAGYVVWKSNFVPMESYGDLAVPAVMALFVASLLLVAAALLNQQREQQS